MVYSSAPIPVNGSLPFDSCVAEDSPRSDAAELEHGSSVSSFVVRRLEESESSKQPREEVMTALAGSAEGEIRRLLRRDGGEPDALRKWDCERQEAIRVFTDC